MNVDLTNYEALLLDYIEGNLRAEEAAELILFLELHPELKIDLDGINEICLDATESLSASFKHELKKESAFPVLNFEELCVVFYEGELSDFERNQLNLMVDSSASMRQEFINFANAYLVSDLNLTFTGKSILKKTFMPETEWERVACAALEGELNLEAQTDFEQTILGNRNYQVQWEAFKKSILIADSITFKEKSTLYRQKEKLVNWPVIIGALAIAAAFLLTLEVSGLFNDKVNTLNVASVAHSNASSLGVKRLSNHKEIVKVKDAAFEIEGSNNVAVSNGPQKEMPKIPINSKEEKVERNNPSFIGLANRLNQPELPILQSKQWKEIKPLDLNITYLSSAGIQELDAISKGLDLEKASAENKTSKSELLKYARTFLNKDGVLNTSLGDLQESGLKESGIKGIERISGGSVAIYQEKGSNGNSQIIGFSIGGIGFSRSSGK